ncbi:hypothetical protein TSUD_232260 [Trifolium subterraneum]|uniref:Uncharacterized protein n=1 Tax=Trifolium subterraneum TaxID=3900 RepID=A0A2Z6LJ08_TRISU|nr:hypothetical protein TSUD_232260 [Trifolium subterraneum]
MEGYNKKQRMDHSSARNGDDDVKPENSPISFSLKDLPITGTDVALPMVIKLQINNFSVLRVSVNEGSAANILYCTANILLVQGYPLRHEVLGEMHTIACYRHQHLRIQNIVCGLRMGGTFHQGSSSELHNMA